MQDEAETFAYTALLCFGFLGLGVILLIAAVIQLRSFATTASNLVLGLR